MWYLFVLIAAQGVLYLAVFYTTPIFFNAPSVPGARLSLRALVSVLATGLAVAGVSYIIPDLEWGNRILHAVGGGCVGMLACYLGVRDSKHSITRLQFLVLSLLLVTSLGVANEIVEFVLQNYFDHIAATTINDTWLDLVSNTIGALFASAFLVPRISRQVAQRPLTSGLSRGDRLSI